MLLALSYNPLIREKEMLLAAELVLYNPLTVTAHVTGDHVTIPGDHVTILGDHVIIQGAKMLLCYRKF